MNNMNKLQVSLTLDTNILAWIDMERNNINRSTFINKLLKEKYSEFKNQFDWEFEDNKAENDIKKGEIKKFDNTKEAVKWLKS
ncbi:MAG: hypothetical protein LBF97_01750 [Elusimicrobiota bacterium]|jgi:hypothetical protein|nr:hypothetical protein [Elusimicrobiota bacterium]